MHCVFPKMKLTKNKFTVFITTILVVYVYLFYLMIKVWDTPGPLNLKSVKLPYVVVHIDLKGAPLKLKYLESILPMLKKHGANGLLIEYEDMFPYEGKLVNISAKDCYGKKELQHFLKAAMHSGFEVIPLIQTFGHMEHVLKLQEFKHLREVERYSDSICPSKAESRELIVHMLEQVIKFHYSVVPLKNIHIGCDEVYNMYSCQQCITQNTNMIDLFTDHVRFVAHSVTKLSPHTTILFWDDMLRHVNPITLDSLNYFNNIEPVYWNYSPDFNVSYISLFDYHKKFKNIWIASAYKGADGIVATLPLLKHRLSNHFSWMNNLIDYKFAGENNVHEFRGIILTGWSRYSHFEPLCELFPVAIPSLVANLILIGQFKKGLHRVETIRDNLPLFCTKYISEELSRSLKCNINTLCDQIPSDGFDHMIIKTCNFESRSLYYLMFEYELLKTRIEEAFSYEIYAYLEYYAKVKFVGPKRQEESIKWFEANLFDLKFLEKNLPKIMKNYYTDNVIREYIDYKTYSLKNRLEYNLKLLKSLNSTSVWNRKPFNTVI